MAKSYRHLDMQERALIETQLAFGMKPSAIAAGLMRSPSTVTRQMHRDLIIGKSNLSQVGTLVERSTLFVALVKLSSTRAELAAEAFTKKLNRFDSQMRRSMTYDQGSEMKHHKTLTENTGVDVYFATRMLRGSAASAKTRMA